MWWIVRAWSRTRRLENPAARLSLHLPQANFPERRLLELLKDGGLERHGIHRTSYMAALRSLFRTWPEDFLSQYPGGMVWREALLPRPPRKRYRDLPERT